MEQSPVEQEIHAMLIAETLDQLQQYAALLAPYEDAHLNAEIVRLAVALAAMVKSR